MQFDERRFSLQAHLLLAGVIVCFDPINDLASVANYRPDHIAFEGVGFADRMMPTRFRFMFQRSSIDPFSHIERSATWAAEYIDVISPRYCAQIGINSCSVPFKFHDFPNPDDPQSHHYDAKMGLALMSRAYQVQQCRALLDRTNSGAL